jgi:hypothetical protein
MGIVINFPSKGAAAKGSAVAQPARATPGLAPAPSLKPARTRSIGVKSKPCRSTVKRRLGFGLASARLPMASGALDRDYRPQLSTDSDGLLLEHPQCLRGLDFSASLRCFYRLDLSGRRAYAGRIPGFTPGFGREERMTQSTSRLNVYRGRFAFLSTLWRRSKRSQIGS